jgi:hypothetical protein
MGFYSSHLLDTAIVFESRCIVHIHIMHSLHHVTSYHVIVIIITVLFDSSYFLILQSRHFLLPLIQCVVYIVNVVEYNNQLLTLTLCNTVFPVTIDMPISSLIPHYRLRFRRDNIHI